jgi:hypothetical protein
MYTKWDSEDKEFALKDNHVPFWGPAARSMSLLALQVKYLNRERV